MNSNECTKEMSEEEATALMAKLCQAIDQQMQQKEQELGWRGKFDARQRNIIATCIGYAMEKEPCGLPGHALMLVIAKMAYMMDHPVDTELTDPRPICPDCGEVMVKAHYELEDGWRTFWMCGCKTPAEIQQKSKPLAEVLEQVHMQTTDGCQG